MPRRLARLCALTIGLAAITLVNSCASLDTPAGGSASAIPPIPFKERTLPNGLKLITSYDANSSNATVQVWYQVGSKDDPQGRSGFAHLFEHLMFKATRDLPAESFDRLTEDVGGWNNASTYDDFTNYYEVVPAAHLQQLLWAEAERMGSLVVDTENFNSERHVVEEELRQRILADPYGRLFGLMISQATYTTHPYRRPGIGSIEELDAATLDDVLAFHHQYYRPDNAALVVVGNFDEAQLNAWVDQYFGPLKNPDQPVRRVTTREPARTAPRVFNGFGPNVPLPAVAITWLTPDASSPDAPALKVLDAIMSTGDSSRLYNSLVYNQQIAVQDFSEASLPAGPGYFAVGAIMSSGHTVDEGEAALLAEMKKIQDAPPSAAELEEAKNTLITGKLRDRETVDGRAYDLAYAYTIEGDPAKANSELSDIRAVTAADVQRVARKYLTPNTRVTIRYRAEADAKPGEATPVPPAPRVASVTYTGPVFTLAPEGQRQAPPPIGRTVEPVIPAPVERRLANGLRVIVVKSSDLPLVTARLTVRAGAWADPAGKSGAVSMTADMLTQGTATRNATDIASQVEALGATLSASAASETTSVNLNLMADKLSDGMALMADVVRNPAFAAEELERQRSQALDNLQVAYQDPGSLANFAYSPIIFAGTALGHVADGTPASIKRLDPADLKAIHQAYYRPDNATLVLSGDITPEEGFALAERMFGDWRGEPGALPAEPPSTPSAAPRNVVINLPGTGQAAVYVGGPAIARNDPAYYPAQVANGVLGNGYSSRLNEEIRIKRGLSYGASSNFAFRQTGGAYIAGAQTKNESAAEVLGLIRGELSRLGAEPVPSDELFSRKAVVIGDFDRRLETTNGVAGLVSELVTYGLPLDEMKAYRVKVEAVTAQQVETFAARTYDPAKASVIIAGDASVFLDDLKPMLPGAEVIPVDQLDLDSADLKSGD